MNPVPSVGRIVHYTPPDQGTAGKSQAYPAVITHVWSDTCVNLQVFNDGSYPLPAEGCNPTSVSLAGDPNSPTGRTWCWPPRT